MQEEVDLFLRECRERDVPMSRKRAEHWVRLGITVEDYFTKVLPNRGHWWERMPTWVPLAVGTLLFTGTCNGDRIF